MDYGFRNCQRSKRLPEALHFSLRWWEPFFVVVGVVVVIVGAANNVDETLCQPSYVCDLQCILLACFWLILVVRAGEPQMLISEYRFCVYVRNEGLSACTHEPRSTNHAPIVGVVVVLVMGLTSACPSFTVHKDRAPFVFV